MSLAVFHRYSPLSTVIDPFSTTVFDGFWRGADDFKSREFHGFRRYAVSGETKIGKRRRHHRGEPDPRATHQLKAEVRGQISAALAALDL